MFAFVTLLSLSTREFEFTHRKVKFNWARERNLSTMLVPSEADRRHKPAKGVQPEED